MKKVNEKTKSMVDKIIDGIKKGDMSIGFGYDKFSNGLNGKAFTYYINTLLELNMIKINNSYHTLFINIEFKIYENSYGINFLEL